MTEENKEKRAISTPPPEVTSRRVQGGSTVRLLYGSSLIVVFIFFIYHFGQVLIFFEGPGIVTADISSVSLPYTSHISSINITPGIKVDKGEELATAYSPEISAEISRILIGISNTTQQIDNLRTKLNVANSTLETAKIRASSASIAKKNVLGSRPEALNTTFKLDVLREAATAEQSAAQLAQDKEIAAAGIISMNKLRVDLERQLTITRRDYNEGKVLSPKAGLIGSRVAHVGETLIAGQSIAEVFDETDSYIKWLMPYTKWRQPKFNDPVYVVFGNNYLKGRVTEVVPITELLDNKRTPVLREPEQGQIVKIKLENDSEVLPIGAQVGVRMLYFSSLDKLYGFVSRILASGYVHY